MAARVIGNNCMNDRSLIILWAIWAATVQDSTQAATGNRWEEMPRQGFESLRLLHHEYLPLRHNSPEAIDAELRVDNAMGSVTDI